MKAIVKMLVNNGDSKDILCITLKRAVLIEKSKIDNCIIGLSNRLFMSGNMVIFCVAELSFVPIGTKYFGEIAGTKFEITEYEYKHYLNAKTIELNGKKYKIREKDVPNIRLCITCEAEY